ncbi:MAG: hypothetical protein GY757_14040 [bacterium]|nr:hypothetical protein [bacterium]
MINMKAIKFVTLCILLTGTMMLLLGVPATIEAFLLMFLNVSVLLALLLRRHLKEIFTPHSHFDSTLPGNRKENSERTKSGTIADIVKRKPASTKHHAMSALIGKYS